MADPRENSRGRKETRCVNTRALGTMSDPLETDLRMSAAAQELR